MPVRLTIAVSDNPCVQPLKDGAVKPQNIELDFITLEPGTLFYRNLFYDEFDVSESRSRRRCWRGNEVTGRNGTGRRCRCS